MTEKSRSGYTTREAGAWTETPAGLGQTEVHSRAAQGNAFCQ